MNIIASLVPRLNCNTTYCGVQKDRAGTFGSEVYCIVDTYVFGFA